MHGIVEQEATDNETNEENEILTNEASDIDGDHSEHKALQYNHTAVVDEVPEDYTSGPSRFIAATDGINPSFALLLRHDLCQCMKKAVRIQRVYSKEQLYAKAQWSEVSAYEDELQLRIREQSKAARNAENPQEQAVFEQSLEVLESLLRSVPAQKSSLESRLKYREFVLLEAYAEVGAFIDEALTEAQLADADDDEEIPLDRLDVEEQFKLACPQSEEHDQAAPDEFCESPPPTLQDLEENPERMGQPSTAWTLEEEAKHEARVTLHEARRSLEEAQHEFDSKEMNCQTDLNESQDAEMRGEGLFDATQTDFDLRWVSINRELTGNLVSAERAFHAAKASAVALGCEIEDDTEVRYGGGYYIEYFESDHIVEGNFAEDPRIAGWLDNVPDASMEDPETVAEARGELCEWECREVDISDSLSAVDYDYQRSKIDEWQLACRTNRES
jgi:hypothetical protein